jgi:FkbM family methyltransferase
MTFMLRAFRNALKAFAPDKAKSRYLHYTLHHYKNDGLINEIRKSSNGVYEPLETALLVKILKKGDRPVMLDIGANIGLMTLNVAAQVNPLQVYAFEPGPKQYSYLEKNIHGNSLQDRVTIFNVALSASKGIIDFHMHTDQHSSGDGILDTGRAGESVVIQVPSLTLDQWWEEHNQPHVNVIKIDTEGAELMILQKAVGLLKKCRPYILVEMCDINFEKYGLTYPEHLDFFKAQGYAVFDTHRKNRIEKSADIAPGQYYFLAIPDEYDKVF